MTSASVRSRAIAAFHDVAHRTVRARLRFASAGDPGPASIAVVSALGRANGLSRGAELQHAAFSTAGLSSELVDVDTTPRRFARSVPHHRASTYVFHAAAPETPLLMNGVLPDAASARRVGFWAWELPDPPPDWKRYEDIVTEVWTPSSFSAAALRRLLAVPVHVVPHRVPVQPHRRRRKGAPFTVLTMADGRSSFERKNPKAAIAADARAFSGSASTRLVVKLSGRPGDAAAVEEAVAGRTDISVIADRLDDGQMTALFRSADVLLSLHRAEGFGLPMLEAMAHGIPVVATGWSGNCDYMTPSNSVLVPWTPTPVRDEGGVYGGLDSWWADPDIDAAAEALRRLADDPESYEATATAAHNAVAALEAVVHPHPEGERSG